MSQNVDFQSLLTKQFETVVSLTGVMAKDVSKIVAEAQDFSVISFQNNAALMRKLAGVKSVDELIRLHSDHAKASYEATLARSKKIGELLTELSKDTLKTVAARSEQTGAPVKAPSVGRNLQAAE